MKLIIKCSDKLLFDGDFDQFEDCFFALPHEYTEEQCLEMIRDWCKQLGYNIEVFHEC